MGFEVSGKIHVLYDTEQKTERFRVRQFVLETGDNPRYPQLVLFQLTGDRCEALDGFSLGDEVRVEFTLRGREWTSPRGDVKYFNSLDVWKIAQLGAGTSESDGDEPPPLMEEPPGAGEDDLPF